MAIQADDVTKLLKKMEGTVVKVGKNGKTALSKGFRSVDEAMEASEKVSAQVVEEEANIRKAINQEQRRLRRLEIENSPNASPEARAKATADLDRPHSKNMTAEEWKAKEQARKENSQAGKDYRQKQADLERQAQQNDYDINKSKENYNRRVQAEKDAELKATAAQAKYNHESGINMRQSTVKERAMRQEMYNEMFDAIPEKQGPLRDIDVSQNKISPEQKAKNEALKQKLTERKIQREGGAAAPEEVVRDRHKNPLTAEERKARGLGGQSKAEYDAQLKAERRAEAQSQKAFNEAQETIDKQNQGLVKRTLGNISDAGKKMISNINDVRTGAARQRAADFASDYNEILRKNGSTDFIDIKGGKKLQGQYEGMSAQQIYDAQQQAAEEAAAKAEEFSKWWAGKKDGITEFAKENPMITAAGIAGTAIIGASLLDND